MPIGVVKLPENSAHGVGMGTNGPGTESMSIDEKFKQEVIAIINQQFSDLHFADLHVESVMLTFMFFCMVLLFNLICLCFNIVYLL